MSSDAVPAAVPSPVDPAEAERLAEAVRHDLYVRLHPRAENTTIHRTAELLTTDAGGVMVDYAASGEPLGLEVLGAVDVEVDGRRPVLAALDAARAEVAEARAKVERLRARTHEIQAQEMTKRAALDSEIAEWRTRYEAAKEWTETLPEAALSTSPWWFQSYAEKSALLRLVTERDEALAEVERLRKAEAALARVAARTGRHREVQRLEAEVEILRAQRGAALALHCPDEIGGRPACGHCSMAGLDGAGVPVGPVLIVGWPCPTAETLGVTE